MSAGRLYVIGAGVAGLACATQAAAAGRAVTLIEAAPRPGGRCRSYFEPALGTDIDNGNHLVLSGNTDAMTYLDRIGARDTVDVLPSRFPFVDLATGAGWCIDLGAGRVPWWIFSKQRRVPGTGLAAYWRSRRILNPGPSATVAEVLGGTGALYEKFWKPFSIAVLNTQPDEAQAALLAPVVRETLGQGGSACRPVLAKRGLGHSFAEPALAYLSTRDAEVRLSSRLQAIEAADGRASRLIVDGADIALAAPDRVVLALPPGAAADLIPGLDVPTEFRSIVNAHFRAPAPAGLAPIMGLLGGLAEWLFVRGEIASVTVSAAESVIDWPAERLAAAIWRDIARLLGRDAAALPAYRIIKEKRATIAQTPGMAAHRPGPKSGLENLWLCGDWTDTGLPATIEGAVRSGHRAAGLVLN